MKLNRAAYEKLIAENLEWLKQQPRTLERDHIILIVEHSADHEYREDPIQPDIAINFKRTGMIRRINQHRRYYARRTEEGERRQIPVREDPEPSWDPIGGRPINPDVMESATMSDEFDTPKLERTAHHLRSDWAARVDTPPVMPEICGEETSNGPCQGAKGHRGSMEDIDAANAWVAEDNKKDELLALAQKAADARAECITNPLPLDSTYFDKWAASEVAIGMELDHLTRWVGSADCKVNPIESWTCERETTGCDVVHGDEGLFYGCVACSKLIASHGMCRKCSHAWGLGRAHGLNRAAEYLIKTLDCDSNLVKEMFDKIMALK